MENLSCRLSTPELQKRKATILESLRHQVNYKDELPNGYKFGFPGSDRMIMELTEFIKTERACCGFFTFSLTIPSESPDIFLTLTGPDGVKDFVKTELGL
jgi:hypothetical protein